VTATVLRNAPTVPVYAGQSLAVTLAANPGRHLKLGPGTFDVPVSLAPSANTIIEGVAGATILRSGAAPTTPIINITTNGVQVKGVAFSVLSGVATSRGYGVHVHGNAANVVLEDLSGSGFVMTVAVGYGATGAGDGTVTNLSMLRVRGNTSPNSWGIGLDDCDGVSLIDCYGTGNWLDGLKLRKKTKNVTVLGGEYSGNGASGTGDGIDAYAGGDTFVISGTICDDNAGNGLTIKQALASPPITTAEFGYVRNVQLANLRARNNTNGSGLYMSADPGVPLVSHVSVTGGLFEGNSQHGVYLGTRNATVVGAIAKLNGEHGFITEGDAMETTLSACLAIANSQSLANGFDGFNLSGFNGKVLGCQAIGVNGDDVDDSTDYAALTKYHRNGVLVTSIATGSWYVGAGTTSTHHLTSPSATGLASAMTSGDCRIDAALAAFPNTTGAWGSMGGRVVHTSAPQPFDVEWIKTVGAPNTPTSGWTRGVQFQPMAALPVAAVAMRYATVVLTGGAGVADVAYLCRKNAADAYEWVVI